MCRRLSLERARIFGIRNDMNHDQSGLHDVTVCVRCMAMGAVGWGGECIASPSPMVAHPPIPSVPACSCAMRRRALPLPAGIETPFPYVRRRPASIHASIPPATRPPRGRAGPGRRAVSPCPHCGFGIRGSLPVRRGGRQREPRRTAVCIRSPVSYRIAAAVRLERCGLDLLVLVLS